MLDRSAIRSALQALSRGRRVRLATSMRVASTQLRELAVHLERGDLDAALEDLPDPAWTALGWVVQELELGEPSA